MPTGRNMMFLCGVICTDYSFSELVETNLRIGQDYQHRSPRSFCARRDGRRFSSDERTLQGSHSETPERNFRARIENAVRHVGSVRPSEAASVRRLWRLSQSARQRPPTSRSFLRQNAHGLLRYAQNNKEDGRRVEGTGAASKA